MKEFTVTELGLTSDGRAILPGSKLMLKSEPPTSWKRVGSVTNATVSPKQFTVATPAAGQELEAVRAEYERVVGKKPHHKAKIETLQVEIAQADTKDTE